MTQKITPCLWFNRNAQEAVDFYISVFKDGKIIQTSYYTESSEHGKAGEVLLIEFDMNGQRFQALNGGIDFEYTHSVSMSLGCKDQAEIDYYWDALSAGGKIEQCGWLQDKFGLYWQICPENVGKYLTGDPKKVDAYMKAMMKMIKLDIATLDRAYNEQ